MLNRFSDTEVTNTKALLTICSVGCVKYTEGLFCLPCLKSYYILSFNDMMSDV